MNRGPSSVGDGEEIIDGVEMVVGVEVVGTFVLVAALVEVLVGYGLDFVVVRPLESGDEQHEKSAVIRSIVTITILRILTSRKFIRKPSFVSRACLLFDDNLTPLVIV